MEKASKKISFRLTDIESLEFNKKLELSGLTKSTFIRNAIFETKIASRFTEEQLILLRMLRAISNNLNQIAHKANQNKDFLTLAVDLINTKIQINNIINKINSCDL